jgi:hypothetical protein
MCVALLVYSILKSSIQTDPLYLYKYRQTMAGDASNTTKIEPDRHARHSC